MPTKIYLKGNQAVTVKGDSRETALIEKPLRRYAQAIALNGHELELNRSEILCLEYQTEAEFKADLEKQAQAQKEAAEASECRRCGTKSPRAADFCHHCGAALVKKAEPILSVPGRRTQ